MSKTEKGYVPRALSLGPVSLEAEQEVEEWDRTEATHLVPYTSNVQTANLLSTVVNLMNTTIGAGIVALPFAFMKMGLVTGFLVMVVVAFMANYSLRVLVRCANEFGKNSFESLGEVAWGVKGRLFCQVTLLVLLVGALVAYLVIIGALVSPLIAKLAGQDSVYAKPWFTILLITAFPIFPLVCIRVMDKLKYTSFLAMASVLLLAVFVVQRGFEKLMDPAVDVLDKAQLWTASTDIFVGLPIINLIFTSHPNVFFLYYELQRQSYERMSLAVNSTITMSFLIYSLTGIFGYLTFFEGTKANVLLGYLEGDNYAVAVKICLTATVAFSYPLLSYPALGTLDVVLFPNYIGVRPPAKRWYIEAFFLVGITMSLAIAVPSITVIFGLTGATGAVSICYLLPPLFYLKLSTRSWRRCDMIPLFLLLIIGGSMGAISTVVILYDLAKNGIPDV